MNLRRSLIAVCGACAILSWAPSAGLSQQPAENAEKTNETEETFRPKPDMTDLDQIRFLTDSDYPPFNYLDEEGALTGFNVDLARALCDELVVECDVRSTDWAQLVPALKNGETDAVIASIRTSEENLVSLDFTDSYYHTPARFVALKETPGGPTTPEALAGKKIAVESGTAHEAYLRDFYADAEIVPFDAASKAKGALIAGEVDYFFGDGIALMFWLNGTSSENCCEFRGGAYADSRYFGHGVGIAIKRGNRRLRNILDYGLERLRVTGRVEELYLRYFPLSFF